MCKKHHVLTQNKCNIILLCICITTHFDSVISVKQHDLEREIVTIFVVDINECDQIMTLTIQAVGPVCCKKLQKKFLTGYLLVFGIWDF